MKNVFPYVAMVLGIATLFVFVKYEQKQADELKLQSACGQKVSKILLIDVRSAEEFNVKHKEGAINLPLATLETDIIREAPSRDTVLLVYCNSGRRAELAKEMLKRMGYKKVENLHD